MIIDCISDLHGFFPELEGADLLIVAGDLTSRNSEEEHFEFFDWCEAQNYKKIIIIAGNHDSFLQEFECAPIADFDGVKSEYLCDTGIEFEGLKIWGSPWTLAFPGINADCKAFTVQTEEEMADKFSLIPEDTDILITHSPPYGILDAVERGKFLPEVNIYPWTEHTGSESLRKVMHMVKPQLMVFGHIHECGGKIMNLLNTKCVNASQMDRSYNPVNKPVRVIL